MARIVGRTKGWLWWFAGLFCSALFGGRIARADVPPPPYGVEPRPAYGISSRPRTGPVEDPVIRGRAEVLVECFQKPVEAVEPPKEKADEIAKREKELATAAADAERLAKEGKGDEARTANEKRLAAFRALSEAGPEALGTLRERAGDEKAPASEKTQCGQVIARIEAVARAPVADKLKGLGWTAARVVNERLQQARNETREAESREQEAKRRLDGAADDAKSEAKTEHDRALEALEKARGTQTLLAGLYAHVSAGAVAPVAPVQPPVFRPPVDESKYGARPRPVAKYGVRR